MVGKHITSSHTSEVQLLGVDFHGFPSPPTNHTYVITFGIGQKQHLTFHFTLVKDYVKAT